MTARFNSKCPGCKKTIIAGSPIVMHRGRAHHQRDGCVPAAKARPAPSRHHGAPAENDDTAADELEAALARI